MQLTFACNCESPVLSGRPVIRPAYPCVRVSEVSSPHFPALSTERLTLRVIAPHDVAEFRALMSVPEVTRYSNWPEAPTYDQANEWTRNLAELFPSGKGCAWVIAERSSGGFHRRRSLELLLLGMEGRRHRLRGASGLLGARPHHRGAPRRRHLRPPCFRLEPDRSLDPAGQRRLRPRARKGRVSIRGHLPREGLFQRGVSRLPHVRPRGRRCCDGCAYRRRSPRRCRMSSEAGQMCRHLKTGRSTRDTLDA